jgi:para-aminobenzoate synthetase component 1
VARVREYIFAGDIFQANLSQRFEAPLPQRPWTFYRTLRRVNPAPFGAFFDVPGAPVLSTSPERFLRVSAAGHVETRPIKGTRARGVGPEHDAALGQALTESAKDRAENLMIVDLMRNDLSRVCAPSSVRASELFALERYATVHHLVSTVVGDQGTDGDIAVHAAVRR